MRLSPYASMFLRLALLSGALLAASGTAQADAIDGNWCNPERGRFEIRGSQIVTPGGNRLSGNYSRHAYDYVAPAGDAFVGKTVNMVLADEETIHLMVVDGPGKIEVWHRCTSPVS